jgi:hypothetical protein
MSAAADISMSAKTLAHYRFCVQTWEGLLSSSGTTFRNKCLHQPTVVLGGLDKTDYKLSSKISMISALLWFLRTGEGEKPDEFHLYPYIKHRDYLQSLLALEVHERGGELSKKEMANYIHWETIREVYTKMAKRVMRSEGGALDQLQDFVIVALYVLQPPIRADYGNMRVFLEEGDVPSDFRDNYFVLYPDAKFVLWRYKNAGRGGLATKADEHKVEGELLEVLEDWLCKNKTPWLLISRLGSGWRPMTENALSSRVRSIFKRWTGRAASINTLRHAYVSFLREGGAGTEEKRAAAQQMMHHPLTSETYVRVGK